jgi:hypothetical protein
VRRRVAIVIVAVTALLGIGGPAMADLASSPSSGEWSDVCLYPMHRTSNRICVNLPDRLPIPTIWL